MSWSVKTHSSFRLSFLLQLLGWLSRYGSWVLRGCALPYAFIARFKRTCYQRGWRRQYRLPHPVVSVGNLTVGGTGKTPFVIWLARKIHAQGRRVAILSRGYGRQKALQNMIVSDGESLKADWQLAGDEPVLIAQHCPWAIVAVGKDRYRLGMWVLEQFACDCFILDDGYQHLSLYRDVDLLLFDATDLKGLTAVLPSGRMREPLDAAQWADGFVLTRSECVESVQPLQERIEEVLGESITPIVMKSVPQSLTHLSSGTVKELQSFHKKSLLVFSGIGNPEALCTSLVASGLDVREEMRFPDHYSYDEHDVEAVRRTLKQSGIDMAVTTEKDQGKLRTWCKADDPIWVVNMEFELIRGEHSLRGLLGRHGLL